MLVEKSIQIKGKKQLTGEVESLVQKCSSKANDPSNTL